ncbi:MAG: superoxide dismutase [Phycisphaerales bacterium]|nr:superoxide dismutase [Phycisphaerales bacterium]
MSSEINRRQALTTMTAAAGIAGLSAIASGSTRLGTLTSDQLGFNSTSGEYKLPDLPYDYDALSPHIDVMTMTIHHSKHHAGYVRGLNNAIKQLRSIREGTGDASTIQHWQRQLSFHAGGHINHTLFWTGMSPSKDTGGQGGGSPTGSLAQAIGRDFGSFDQFANQFKAASKSVEGSGWGWLVYEPIAQQLMITQMQNQQDMLFAGAIPLLGVDVWEHAYYLTYQNRRADYINAFMNVINWSEIQRRYDHATT